MSNHQVIDLTLDSSSDDDDATPATTVSLLTDGRSDLLMSLFALLVESPKKSHTRISHLILGPRTEINTASHELMSDGYQIEAGDDAILWC